MRIHLRIGDSVPDDILIRRWLTRCRKGARRQAMIRAALLDSARAFFEQEEQNLDDSDSNAETPVAHAVEIPSMMNLGQLIQRLQPPTAVDQPTSQTPRARS
jgi:DNA-directed RNA polymerase specialized sigma24 family protein